MTNLLEFKNSDPDIGISTRTQIEGPESTLLNEFVKQYVEQEVGTLKKHYALFYEPLLPTGYPDLVIVTYQPQKYDSWTDERTQLEIIDLKVLHHLYFVNGSTSSTMEYQLGFDSKCLLRSLERLMDAALVRRAKQCWMPKRLNDITSISNIRTIEAKISDWRGVFCQASMNRLFSSESYVLSPVSKPSAQVINRAKEGGIGMYSMPLGKQVKTVQQPVRSGGLPVSYASWLFNEWIGRQLFRKRSAV